MDRGEYNVIVLFSPNMQYDDYPNPDVIGTLQDIDHT